ncbi:MAG: outer membrane lipoprotein-sorting protein [Verrucomicrobiota bacterium]|jgi:hypothetical protein
MSPATSFHPARARYRRAGAWLLACLAAVLAGAAEETTPTAEGQALAAELRLQRPSENLDTAGVLHTRDANGKWTAPVTVHFTTQMGADTWQSIYEALDGHSNVTETLIVTHAPPRPNGYVYLRTTGGASGKLNSSETALPFAGSEFWLGDLGLDFFDWPQQRIAKREMRKGRSCRVLESVNPDPKNGTYGRVLSWIDVEHKKLVRAEAYDTAGNMVKEFSIGSVKKVGGYWQLKSMEIRNARTDARTRLEFDLQIPDAAP